MLSLRITLGKLDVKEVKIKTVKTIEGCVDAVLDLYRNDQGFAMVIFEKESRMSDTFYIKQVAEFKKKVTAAGVPVPLLPHIVSLKSSPLGSLSG